MTQVTEGTPPDASNDTRPRALNAWPRTLASCLYSVCRRLTAVDAAMASTATELAQQSPSVVLHRESREAQKGVCITRAHRRHCVRGLEATARRLGRLPPWRALPESLRPSPGAWHPHTQQGQCITCVHVMSLICSPGWLIARAVAHPPCCCCLAQQASSGDYGDAPLFGYVFRAASCREGTEGTPQLPWPRGEGESTHRLPVSSHPRQAPLHRQRRLPHRRGRRLEQQAQQRHNHRGCDGRHVTHQQPGSAPAERAVTAQPCVAHSAG